MYEAHISFNSSGIPPVRFEFNAHLRATLSDDERERALLAAALDVWTRVTGVRWHQMPCERVYDHAWKVECPRYNGADIIIEIKG